MGTRICRHLQELPQRLSPHGGTSDTLRNFQTSKITKQQLFSFERRMQQRSELSIDDVSVFFGCSWKSQQNMNSLCNSQWSPLILLDIECTGGYFYVTSPKWMSSPVSVEIPAEFTGRCAHHSWSRIWHADVFLFCWCEVCTCLLCGNKMIFEVGCPSPPPTSLLGKTARRHSWGSQVISAGWSSVIKTAFLSGEMSMIVKDNLAKKGTLRKLMLFAVSMQTVTCRHERKWSEKRKFVREHFTQVITTSIGEESKESFPVFICLNNNCRRRQLGSSDLPVAWATRWKLRAKICAANHSVDNL